MMIRPEIGGDLQRGAGAEGEAGRPAAEWIRQPARCSAAEAGHPASLAAQSTSISLGNVSI